MLQGITCATKQDKSAIFCEQTNKQTNIHACIHTYIHTYILDTKRMRKEKTRAWCIVHHAMTLQHTHVCMSATPSTDCTYILMRASAADMDHASAGNGRACPSHRLYAPSNYHSISTTRKVNTQTHKQTPSIIDRYRTQEIVSV